MRFVLLLLPVAASAQDAMLRGAAARADGASPEEVARRLFPLQPDPFADFARTGLDRSLSQVHLESELSPSLSREELDAISGYISAHSRIGSDDGTLENAHDRLYREWEESVPSRSFTRRALMPGMDMDDTTNDAGHAHMHYVQSSCNSMIGMATCVPWSEYFNGTDYSSEVKIPCGECVTLDASPSQPMYGSSLDFAEGLNVVGKLEIPNDANVEIRTKYVFVQGQLTVPAPAGGSTTAGIPSSVVGNRVKITLYGHEELMFMPDNATDNTHLMGENVGTKAFVVAGGKVDIQAMDPTCPSWTKLQSVSYGVPLPNVAFNKTATQSSTYNNNESQDGPHLAVDGNQNSFTHTKCNQAGINQWWKVDLEEVYTISSVSITNRLDCCGGRLHNFTIAFLDENENEVSVVHEPGQLGNQKSYSADYVNARHILITLGDIDCLQLGEVEVFGYLASDSMPVESLDALTVGADAARCWSAPGSRILLTSDTYSWADSNHEVVADVPYEAGSDKIYLLPMSKKKTAADETFGYPDFAVEVALLERSLVIEGEQGTGDLELIGGHFIVLHTPHVHQHVEGALLVNMGQQGRLGRYPLHFHMSECVHGSTLAKNVIWKSNQRCVVVHGSHNVTVRENVAYDTQGHCYMLEDGGEWDNSFLYNLGAKTRSLPAGVPRAGETDNRASTFWITNPSNHWIGNVAAGSQGPGFWFELKLRAPSSELDINHGVNPKHLALGTFDDNTAHSAGFRAGITTYETGYLAPGGTTWNNIKSYKNSGSGIFQHGTNNIILKGGLLADNGEAARNFHHNNAVYDGVEVIGRSAHVESMIGQGRISLSECANAGGISIQPNEGLNSGTTIQNSVFSGFKDTCTGGKNAAIYVENDQVRNAVFDASPSFSNNTFDSGARISACMSINSSPDGWVRYVAIEDSDGSISGTGPGFYVQNEAAITNFIEPNTCEAEDRCLLFCPGSCLRLGTVSVSQDYTTRGFKMHIQDGLKTATVLRGPIWFDEKQSHLSAQIPIVLPAPTSGQYSISFTDANDQPAWPGYATLSLDDEPTCSGALADTSSVIFDMPLPDERCDDLFHYDDYAAGIHGWQNFFTGMDITQEGESYIISTTRRKSDGGHVSLSRSLDASCFAGLGGRTFSLFGKMRITDSGGNYVATDGTSDLSPKLTFTLDGVMSQVWRIATNSDGTWSEFSGLVTLPVDSSAAWKASIRLDKSEKNEFHIKDWGMLLVPSEAPTASPTDQPSDEPSASPTISPTSSYSPTATAATAAPVPAIPTNLALNGFASAETECYNGWARKAIDGDANTINHSCCGRFGTWLMVDLGKDTVNYIDSIVIKNRADCCGGRLKRFYVEVLDAAKNVVWQTYHYGTVGNGVVKTFPVDDGSTGRFARIRYEDSLKDCLHIAEMEVWGYPVVMPGEPPAITELALNMPSESSSRLSNQGAERGNDGNFGNKFEAYPDCALGGPFWKVDLGAESFVQSVVITNRVDCCGGRLKNAVVEILDADGIPIESREIVGSVGNGQVVEKVFNEDTSVGRYVRVSYMTACDYFHLAEVSVYGYHVAPLAALPAMTNFALSGTATQSSKYNNINGPAEMAIDGIDTTYTHTYCWQGFRQWWQVDLGVERNISTVHIVNRLDCCGGRLHDFTIHFCNDAATCGDVTGPDDILAPGQMGDRKTFYVGGWRTPTTVNARYVRIVLGDEDCLQLGEVQVLGYE